MGVERTEVLIVGAGPTGLVLAIWLRRLGVDVRIVDKTATAGTTSRALAVHARTLELYRQIGIADEIVAHGLELPALNVWARGRHVARVAFGAIGRGLSPFPYVLMLPQDEHEEILVAHLGRLGVDVERRSELLGFEERGDRVISRLRGPDGGETTVESSFIAGCDGAHSTVREALGIGLPGGTYERVFYVADVELHGPVDDHELHIAVDEADFVAVFPMKGAHRARLIGTVRRDAEAEAERPLAWSDVSQQAVDRMKVTVETVRWFSTYRVHHRVADRFRAGRAFLAGDAAHIHSPVGGQGMNTGIGDAVNLAWKLAATIRGRAHPSILESFEPERIAFARRLVATTDRAFSLATQEGALVRRVRLSVFPRLAAAVFKGQAARRFLFRTVSQTLVNYRGRPLSEGKAGRVRGGDRLPWVLFDDDAAGDNFVPLTSVDWQLHVYGEPTPALLTECSQRHLALHAFKWHPRMADAGFARDAAYLVRPDGYVALADGEARAENLARYVDAHGLRFSDMASR
jgi:2-polyprenyl-6-methoxyphenol hydroxylase-like FAD-dependent oxidoreductase